jgi:hypothetical protein
MAAKTWSLGFDCSLGQSVINRSIPRAGGARFGITFRKVFLMAKNIYVGNLSWEATHDDLLALFQEHGKVKRAQVISDRETGRSRGFGFVEMYDDGEAERAIQALNGADFNGRPLKVNEAQPRENRGGPGGGGGGGGNRGYGGGGYGGGGDRGRRY